MSTPEIPEYITVHLGLPNDAAAPNVRVPFVEYIKNVASSEIYPTWPEAALRANILSQISFALNRIYTEWYPSRGYNFDITSTTQFDQKYIPGREIFGNISELVDEIFNDYVIREGYVQPLFTQYCNGTTVTCDGLSQWGTVELANDGLVPYEILQHYFGDNIGIVYDAPTGPNLPSYPGRALHLGTASEEVRTIQRQLNRIARNYPAIGPALELDGIYGPETESAVRNFQQIFNLTADGIVGKATWYKIKSIYNAVKRLGELESEGLTFSEVDRLFSRTLGPGDTGNGVRIIQYYLAVLGYFDNTFPRVEVTGAYDAATEAAVRAFQLRKGLTADGVIGRETWYALEDAYQRIRSSIAPLYSKPPELLYPGIFLSPGQTGDEVKVLQELLRRAAQTVNYIPPVTVNGVYDAATENAVLAVQREFGLPQNGITGALTWGVIVNLVEPAALSI